MTQPALPFQYQAEKKDSGLTGFAGLPLYVELAKQSGLFAIGLVGTISHSTFLVIELAAAATLIGAIYTFYKVAEHGYGFFKAKYELSTSKNEHVSYPPQ